MVSNIQFHRMDSNDDGKVDDSTSGEPQYANNGQRQAAMAQFQHVQNLHEEQREEADEEHAEDYAVMHELEVEVDEKVQDAIRRAEMALQEAEVEIEEVIEVLGDECVLLQNARIAREGFTEEEQQQINENVVKQ